MERQLAEAGAREGDVANRLRDARERVEAALLERDQAKAGESQSRCVTHDVAVVTPLYRRVGLTSVLYFSQLVSISYLISRHLNAGAR